MGMLLNIQMSVFVNYRIDVAPSNIMKLMERLNSLERFEFLPNIVSGQNINLFEREISTISNLSFITSSQRCSIMCSDDRIDCTLNFTPKDQDTIDNSLSFCNDVLTIIMDSFPILGNRLAININELSNPISTKLQETKLGQAIVNVFDFYKDRVLYEWSTRSNTRFDTKISDKMEKLNVITELNIAENSETGEKRVLCHLDINTIPENKGYRFQKNDLLPFIEETKKIIFQIKDNFEELDDGE